MNREKLVAACGLYCGACEGYRAVQDKNKEKFEQLLLAFNARGGNFTLEDIACDGCLGGGKLTQWCRQCSMKDCKKHQGENRICSPECGDYPCETLSSFSKDNMTHHHEVLENLARLQKVGLKKHAEQEEKRWQCPKCKQPMAWYDKVCSKCGEPRSAKLFKLEYDWPPKP